MSPTTKDNALVEQGGVGKTKNRHADHISNKFSRLIWVADYRFAEFLQWLVLLMAGGAHHE